MKQQSRASQFPIIGDSAAMWYYHVATADPNLRYLGANSKWATEQKNVMHRDKLTNPAKAAATILLSGIQSLVHAALVSVPSRVLVLSSRNEFRPYKFLYIGGNYSRANEIRSNFRQKRFQGLHQVSAAWSTFVKQRFLHRRISDSTLWCWNLNAGVLNIHVHVLDSHVHDYLRKYMCA